jgi:hypothetical protein
MVQGKSLIVQGSIGFFGTYAVADRVVIQHVENLAAPEQQQHDDDDNNPVILPWAVPVALATVAWEWMFDMRAD